MLLAFLSWAAPASLQAAAFEIIAHRGGRAQEPENTVEALAAALATGVSGLHVNLVFSADDVPVAHHGYRLDDDRTRGADGEWLTGQTPLVRDLSYRELRRYDVGRPRPRSVVARHFPDQYPEDGARIPSLADVYTFLRRSRREDVGLFLEVGLTPTHRAHMPAPRQISEILLRIIKGERALDQTWVQAFDWIVLRGLLYLEPKIRTAFLTVERPWLNNIQRGKPGPSPWLGGIDIDDYDGSIPKAVKAAGGRIWAPFWRDLTPESLSEAHELGLRVVVWLVNDRETMNGLIQLGVDGIITDDPAALREVVHENGLPLPDRSFVKP